MLFNADDDSNVCLCIDLPLTLRLIHVLNILGIHKDFDPRDGVAQMYVAELEARVKRE